MTTANKVASKLRGILKDYNYFPFSESDSPLKINVIKQALDSTAILKLDSRLRIVKSKQDAITNYKVPINRTIKEKTLESVLKTAIINAIEEINVVADNIDNGLMALENLEIPAEALEFLVQLYSEFKVLNNSRIFEISTNDEVFVSLIMAGEVIDNNNVSTIVASTLLVQT